MGVDRRYLALAEVELQRAAGHHDRGLHRAALDGYLRVVTITPNRLEAVGSVGLILRELAHPAAHLWLSRAVSIAPRSEAALHNLALACREADANASMRALRRLVVLAPQHIDATRLLGEASADAVEARRLLGRAYAIDPSSSSVLVSLGGLHNRLNDHAAARRTFRAAICQTPSLLAALNAAGMLAGASYEDEKAIACYRRGLATESKHPALLENLGRAILRVGRHGEATVILRRATTLSAGRADTLLTLAIAEILLGREKMAVALLRRALAFSSGTTLSTETAQSRVILNVLRYLDGAGEVLPHGKALDLLKARFSDWGWGGVDQLPYRRALEVLRIWESRLSRCAGTRVGEDGDPGGRAGDAKRRIAIVTNPMDPMPIIEYAFDHMRCGVPPRAVARWLARAWAVGRAAAVGGKSLINLKRVCFGVAVGDPEASAPLRSILREPCPYPEDPALARSDAGIGWRYGSGGAKPKVIFVENKFEFGFSGQRGEATTTHISIRQSVSNARVISGTYFYFDEYFLQTGKALWPDLIAFAEKNGCDILVLHVMSNSRVLDPLLPTGDQVQAFRRLGCKILLFGTDLVYPGYRETLRRQLGYIGDAYLAADIPPFLVEELELSRRFDKPVIGGWTPQDLSLFDETAPDRDVEVSFCGNLLGYPDRLPAIGYLRSKGVSVQSNRPGEVLTHDEYVRLLKRSLMVLNFASTFPGRIDPIFSENAQIKGRLLEGMSAGCAVLEKDNGYSKRFFSHMTDIVFYRNLDDALEQIDSLRRDRDLIRQIGRNARAAIAARFGIDQFWTHVLSSLGMAEAPP